MTKINKRRCGEFGGEVQNASPLAMENTQEYQDVIGMSRFKLNTSISYLKKPFERFADSIDNLWLNEGDSVPKFTTKLVDCWSVDDYTLFCEQVKRWALDHDEEPFTELRRRIRELILYDKKSLQLLKLLTITKLLNKAKSNEKVLFDQQADIQQLCNEISEEDDKLFVESNDFKNSKSQFERLRALIQAMRWHSNNLVNQRHARQKLSIVNAKKEAELITKPIKTKSNHSQQNRKAKDHDDELEL